MSKRGLEFLEAWIGENNPPEAYEPEGDHTGSRLKAEEFLIAAKSEGITREEVEAEVGDIEDYMAGAMARATDAEIERLKAKDRR
jgi:hypothetical protein